MASHTYTLPTQWPQNNGFDFYDNSMLGTGDRRGGISFAYVEGPIVIIDCFMPPSLYWAG